MKIIMDWTIIAIFKLTIHFETETKLDQGTKNWYKIKIFQTNRQSIGVKENNFCINRCFVELFHKLQSSYFSFINRNPLQIFNIQEPIIQTRSVLTPHSNCSYAKLQIRDRFIYLLYIQGEKLCSSSITVAIRRKAIGSLDVIIKMKNSHEKIKRSSKYPSIRLH